MTPNELAAYLSVSRRTIYGWVSERKVPFIKLNGILRFDIVEISKWIKLGRKSPYVMIR